jgi:propanediol dehydratase small subunit
VIVAFDPLSDYPLGTKRPDLVRTRSGLGLDDLTLDSLRTGRLGANEMRATPETLRLQAEVARAAGRAQLADSLERAAELAPIDDDVLLEIYTALRPHRSSADELETWANRLDAELGAPKTASFVREAKVVYASRGLLATVREPAL